MAAMAIVLTMAMFVKTFSLRPITLPGYISTSRKGFFFDGIVHVPVQSRLSVSMESFVITYGF
jgi:hypothetical protein